VLAKPRYDEPFFWWGPGWESPAARSMSDLLRDGTIDAWTAAQLWAALARRRSMVVVAEPSGAGKTTLLTALLEFLPEGTRRLYLRGCYEAFSFLVNPEIKSDSSALLINEISPHLPVYLWGPAVAQSLAAGQRGFTLLATAHAESVPALVGLLSGSPLRIPANQVAVFEFVVVLAPSTQAASSRRVTGLWRLHPTPAGVGFTPAPPLTSFAQISPETLWFPAQELLARFELLRDLAEGRLSSLPVVPSPQPAESPVP
jgi:energy-coupling factor transporter ATP-binding protein EcfA2